MNTRFQNSRYRSHSQPGAQVGSPQPDSGPMSKYSSESGPHGPSAPGGPHQLSSSLTIRSGGKPFASQMLSASSSDGWTVTHTRSGSKCSHSVTNSQAQGMIVSLK